MLALLPACSVTPSSPGRRSPRGGIWAQGDSCVTQQPPRFTCHCVLLVLNLSAAVTGGKGPSFSGQLHHRLPWTTSSSALMKLLLYLPFKKTTFVSPPQEKTPGERSASNQSDFSSLLRVFFGCSSGLCFTPWYNSALHPLEPPSYAGDGQAGLGSPSWLFGAGGGYKQSPRIYLCCSAGVSYLGFVTLLSLLWL